MEYKRTIYLLSLLHSATEGDKKERIEELFKRAVTSTDEYQKLKKLLQSTSFIGIDGVDKHDECEQTLQRTIANITNPTNNIKHLDLLIQQVENELKKADGLLSSPGFFDDDFIAVKSESVDLYNRFYRTLANCICYYLISQFGVKAIRNLTFNNKAGFQDVVRLVNQQYGNELFMSYQTKRPLTWKITKASFAEDNFILYEGYKLEYTETPLSSLLQKVQVDEYYRLSPYIFAATSPAVQTPFVGIGNILGIEAINGLSLLDSEIVTALPVSAFATEFEPNDLLGAIKRSLNTDCYCISPEYLIAALNRQRLSNTVAKRRRENKCIFCGKSTVARIACKEHLSIASQQV